MEQTTNEPQWAKWVGHQDWLPAFPALTRTPKSTLGTKWNTSYFFGSFTRSLCTSGFTVWILLARKITKPWLQTSQMVIQVYRQGKPENSQLMFSYSMEPCKLIAFGIPPENATLTKHSRANSNRQWQRAIVFLTAPVTCLTKDTATLGSVGRNWLCAKGYSQRSWKMRGYRWNS